MLKKCRPLLILLLVFALLLGGAFSSCQSAPPSDQTPPDAQTPADPGDEDKDDGNADGDKDDSGDDTDGDTDEEEGKIRLAGIFESYDAGSIKPSGWLYDEMTLMLENATLPAEEIFPELVAAHPEQYAGTGLRDHAQRMHEYLKSHDVLGKMQAAFEVIPDQKLKPADAYHEVVRRNVEFVFLDDMMNRIPAGDYHFRYLLRVTEA